MWRKLRKIFFWTLGIFVSLVLILAFVIWLMQDKIKGYAVDYLNSHLKIELKVDEIDVTFITTFPNVSLHFKNMLILDPPKLQQYRDTLLSAQHVYLKFGLWEVLSSNYKAKQLDIYNAHLRAFINKDGVENYDILKPVDDKAKAGDELVLSLKNIKLYNTRLTYENHVRNQQYKFFTKELKFSGELGKDVFDLETKGDLHIQSFRNKNLVLFKNQESVLDLVLAINTTTNDLLLKKGDWTIGKMLLGIKGKLAFKDEGTQCDIEVFGKNVSLISIMQLLPNKIKSNMDRYKSYGNIDLNATIKGLAGKTKAPDVNASFKITNGMVVEKSSNISLHNIDIKGSYTNSNKLGVDELYIEKMLARFKDGKFDLNGKLTDFVKPHFVFGVKGDFGLSTLHDFMGKGTIQEMKGDVSLNSKLDFVLLRTDDLLLTNTIINEASGTVKFSNATVLIVKGGKPITSLNGQLNLVNNDALVDGLSGKVGESDFSINGAIKNFTPYFISGNQSLTVVGAFQSNYCNINDLVHNPSKEQAQKASEPTSDFVFSFPEKINFNFDLNIAKLEWEPFTSTNIQGNFKLIDKKLSATNLAIDLAGGKCIGELDLEELPTGGFMVHAESRIENVQLPLALKAFKNFGQDFITPLNSKGVLTADVQWVFPIFANLKVDEKHLLANATVSIKNGQLNNVEQLKQVAAFMRSDRKMRLFLKNDADDFEARIRNLKFDELKNELTVKDGLLTIPKMEINSTAMKINFAGTHAFDNNIDYHFNFRFLELKKKENESEFGEIKDDGTGIKLYIHMFGSLDDPKYAWDKEEKKIERQEQWQNEKKTIKSLLKEELGLYKKDTTVKIQKTKEEDVKFILEWDETDPVKNENLPAGKAGKSQSEKDNEKLKKLKKKWRTDENQNKDVKFEIEQQ